MNNSYKFFQVHRRILERAFSGLSEISVKSSLTQEELLAHSQNESEGERFSMQQADLSCSVSDKDMEPYSSKGS